MRWTSIKIIAAQINDEKISANCKRIIVNNGSKKELETDIIEKTAEEINLFDTPLYLCRNTGMSKGQRFIKRFCDILFSLIGLIVTSPILLITALAIKLEDGGPVFFRQDRATIGGNEFSMQKRMEDRILLEKRTQELQRLEILSAPLELTSFHSSSIL